MQSNKESNQKLIERFPFLMPRNRWTGEVPEDYDYIPIRNWIPCLTAGERLLGSKCVKISVRN